jgi:hypothetical protein
MLSTLSILSPDQGILRPGCESEEEYYRRFGTARTMLMRSRALALSIFNLFRTSPRTTPRGPEEKPAH